MLLVKWIVYFGILQHSPQIARFWAHAGYPIFPAKLPPLLLRCTHPDSHYCSASFPLLHGATFWIVALDVRSGELRLGDLRITLDMHPTSMTSNSCYLLVLLPFVTSITTWRSLSIKIVARPGTLQAARLITSILVGMRCHLVTSDGVRISSSFIHTCIHCTMGYVPVRESWNQPSHT